MARYEHLPIYKTALVDEDESVRGRAQELYGQRLAWEAATSVPTEQAKPAVERSSGRAPE